MNPISVIFLALVFTLASAKTIDSTQPATVSNSVFNGSTRVVGGSDANVGQLPHQVSLRRLTGRHFCGGSIIGARWILTSAVCIKFIPTSAYVAVVGATKLSNGGVRHKIAENKPHPDHTSNKPYHNIALLRTKEAIVFNELVKPIALPTEDTLSGAEVIISGWGRLQANGAVPDHLQYLETTVISEKSCERHLLPDITVDLGGFICHFHPNAGICYGDGGKLLNFR